MTTHTSNQRWRKKQGVHNPKIGKQQTHRLSRETESLIPITVRKKKMGRIKDYFAEEIAENSRKHPECNARDDIRTDMAFAVNENVADVDVNGDIVANDKLATPDHAKTCISGIFVRLWWLPSLCRTVTLPDYLNVVDWPADAEHIKSVAYLECRFPGEVWDEHNEGWLCLFHAYEDISVLPTITLEEWLKV